MDTVNGMEEATLPTEDTKSDVTDEATAEEVIAEEEAPAPAEETAEEEIDYEALIASDVQALKSEFPELRGIKDVTDLDNPLRYAALRDLGLTPAEAYLATAKRRAQDNRAHLRSAHGRSAALSMGMMSQHELTAARDLFPGLSDSEIQRLYKRVSK